ncbi:hypothetical protein MBLNU457_7082t1 [Dothideomycetes sp. NU457]
MTPGPSQLTGPGLPTTYPPPPGPGYPPAYHHAYQGPPGNNYPPPPPSNYGPLPPMNAPQDRRMPLTMNHPGPQYGAQQPKRIASGTHPAESPAKKKQSKWSPEEDASIIELRGNGMKWEDISKNLPGRSAISCRLRFQNYLERRSEWDEEKKNKLARLYERFKKDMWEKIAKEMALPWRAAEAMHWQIGEVEMASRANVPVFHLAGQSSSTSQGSMAPSSINISSLGQNLDARSNSGSPRSPAGPLEPYASNADQTRDGHTPQDMPEGGPQDYRRNSDVSGMEDSVRGDSAYPRNGTPRVTAPTTSDSETSTGTNQRQYLSPFPRHAEPPGGRQ